MKVATRTAKEKDKERALAENNLKVIAFDLQALLLSPLLKANSMYYKTKLGCHNFTVFDLCTKDVTCYFWPEANA